MLSWHIMAHRYSPPQITIEKTYLPLHMCQTSNHSSKPISLKFGSMGIFTILPIIWLVVPVWYVIRRDIRANWIQITIHRWPLRSSLFYTYYRNIECQYCAVLADCCAYFFRMGVQSFQERRAIYPSAHICVFWWNCTPFLICSAQCFWKSMHTIMI